MSVVLLLLLLLCVLLLGAVLAVLLRKPEAQALPPMASPESVADAERRLREAMELLRRSAEHSDERQRRELGLQLERLQAVVNEKVPVQVGKTVEARFQADFGKVGTLLDEVRARLEALGGLNTGLEALSGSVKQFSQMLGNVKARGTWGEWQLGNILSDMLAPGQWAANVHPNPRAPKRVVEFAIALPGNDEREQVWLPIDSKFPQEDYERLLVAARAGDSAGEERAVKELIARVKGFARDVHEAYVNPPHTTHFAILYLPTEGLYVEMLKHSDVIAELQQRHKVLLAGPSTLAALINALQMGFQTLAVQKNTVKVLETLKRVKVAMETFAKRNETLHKQLSTAAKTVEEGSKSIRVLERALSDVTIDEPSAQEEVERGGKENEDEEYA